MSLKNVTAQNASGSPQNASVSATTLSDADLIKEAWGTDPNFDILFYVVYGVMYAFTIVPSLIGFFPQVFTKAFMNYYLLYENIVRLFSIESKSKDDPKIWNYTNWLVYSFRRWLVEGYLTQLQVFTQLIPGLNWILNLIPLGLSYVNIFVI